MCGIAGLRRLDGGPVATPDLERMTAELVHRGPDDQGNWSEGSVGFGHRRLSIIDLAGSPQPMSAGPATICFNGEIFNYAALRRELGENGFCFRTHGDTEVLLALYLERGIAGVEAAQGQFAFALHDARSGDLWLVRDRLGVQPLYYYADASLFAFASEVKALLPVIPGGARVNEDRVGAYLAFRSVPWPDTLFAGVHKLAPGHLLRVSADGRIEARPYWQLPTEPAAACPSDAEAIRSVGDALEAAVQSRLVADVPVGAYLSGGVDSSLIVALVREHMEGGRVETFSAGFDDPRYDELPYARTVSRHLGTHHHEVVVSPRDFESLWHRLTWHRDAPVSEPADLAIFRLAELARGTVKVLLSGEGSDELFAGYPKYRFARLAALSSGIPAAVRRPLFGALERCAPASAARARIMLRAMSAGSEAERFQTWFAPFTRSERARLGVRVEDVSHRETWARARGDRIQRMLYVDCHTWLVDNLLERGDRMAMAASVESRPPFLDHRLVELAFSLPSNLKLRGGTTKWVVKEVARSRLPAEIVDRRKVGFRVPLDAWFRSGLREMSRDLLLSPSGFVPGVLDRREIARLLEDHESGRRDEEIRIWTLLCLEVWHEVFFRGKRPWCPA